MENQNTDNKFLGTEKIGKLLKMFSIPCVLSLIIQALYNLVDQIFIGNSSLGMLGNSATAVVYPLTVIALALGLFIGDGSAACISINQGRNQTKDTHKTIGTGITIGLIVSALLVAISFIFRKGILIGFGAKNAAILDYSMEYSTWIIIGLPLFLMACVLNPIILLPLTTKTIYPFYWAAPISDFLTTIVAAVLLINLFKQMAKEQAPKTPNNIFILPSHKGVIITISRQHGAGGREIGQKLVQKLGVPFYDKELTALAAQESGLAEEYIEKIEEKSSVLYDLYLSTEANQAAIKAQENVLKQIADRGSCVIVGRAADYVLKDYNPFKVFIYAPNEFRQKRIMANYGDSDDLAKINMEKADKRRAKFYENITGQEWGDTKNYNLSIDSSIGIDKVVEQIAMAVQNDRQDVAIAGNNSGTFSFGKQFPAHRESVGWFVVIIRPPPYFACRRMLQGLFPNGKQFPAHRGSGV